MPPLRLSINIIICGRIISAPTFISVRQGRTPQSFILHLSSFIKKAPFRVLFYFIIGVICGLCRPCRRSVHRRRSRRICRPWSVRRRQNRRRNGRCPQSRRYGAGRRWRAGKSHWVGWCCWAGRMWKADGEYPAAR